MFHILSCIAGLAFISFVDKFIEFLKERNEKKETSDIKILIAILLTCYLVGRFILLGAIGR